MAQALEYAGIQTQSESMMRDLSRDLAGMGSGDSNVYASVQLDLELVRFCSRQKRASDAQYLLKPRWSWCKMVFGATSKLDDESIALIEDLARELETQKHDQKPSMWSHGCVSTMTEPLVQRARYC
ncbi:hypothetical protein ABVK25_008646 [Lepraria finkii]|uniref:Uncharacterized protein n=1 Tax=Lepraria finkii TaxID=1340010 RepID=A0ABR4AZH2_9LECA